MLVQPRVSHAEDQATNVPQLTEIIVTAEKRQERLQDVPVAVDVVDSAQLARQNIYTVADLGNAIPSLNSGGLTGGTAVRGVSTNGFARSSEGSVSIVLDGVVTGRAQISNLFDINHVEVLSGPQGMLFGKNASAGVISIVTNAPNLNEFEAIAHVDVGDYDYQREQLTLNAPLWSNAALRVSIHHDEQSGIATDTYNGLKSEPESLGVRARLLWKPTDSLSVNLSGDFDQSGDSGIPFATFGIVQTPALAGLLAAQCGIVASVTNTQNCAEGVTKYSSRELWYGGAAQIDYTLPLDYTLTSITAKRWLGVGSFSYRGLGGDTDLVSSNILSTNLAPGDVQTETQEFRLTSPSNQLFEFVAGLLYYHTGSTDSVAQGGTLNLAPFLLGQVTYINVSQTSYSAYGQTTIHATDKLSFIVGGRFDDERLTDVTSQGDGAEYGFVAPFAPFQAINQEVKTNHFSWRLGADYRWTPDLMTYFTVAQGYKGPAVNDQASPPFNQLIISPEIPLDFELGLKATFLDGKAIATVDLFHNRVKDFQTAVFTPPSEANPVPGFGQGNAPWIQTEGVELNVYGHPLPQLTLNAGVIYNHATYSPDFLVACAPEQTPGVGSCVNVGTTADPIGVTQPVSQLANTPKVRFLLNGEYARPLNGAITAFVQSDFVYQSGFDFSPTPDPILHSDPSYILGGRIGVRNSDNRWGVSLFGRNLLGKTYPTLFPDPVTEFNGGGGKSYWTVPTINWYRTYGVTLDARF
jgi:iron complex outermembrane receptor protein